MPLLTGLTADGTEVPVQVEPDGVLVAEGIPGAPGPQGPEGPQGPQGPKGDPGSASVADAWAYVAPDGTFLRGLNIASVTRTAPGAYDVVFATPMPSDKYAIAGSTNNSVSVVLASSLTVNGFTVGCYALVTNTYVDAEFSVTVFATV